MNSAAVDTNHRVVLVFCMAFVVAMLIRFLSACGGDKPAISPHVQDCAASYGSCVYSASDIDSYRACRARVDAVCLPEAGIK